MTGVSICPFCQNQIKMYEADGISRGKCVCGRTHTLRYSQPTESSAEDSSSIVKMPMDRWFYANVQKGGAVQMCGAYETLLEAERACTDRAKKGQRCFVEQMHQTVSEWIDGERDDLKRKFITVEFSYNNHSGERADGRSTIVTTQAEPTYKAIEYYILRSGFTVNKLTVTDDDGRILEESEANTSTPGSSCTEAVE